ncbi:hypothetical protein SAMN03159448_06783 [Sinorhizobium sp. NFACC03]|nr:hypothetical protein SAMN03159448_06783 [Sinorhizobium sp. NFACC03]
MDQLPVQVQKPFSPVMGELAQNYARARGGIIQQTLIHDGTPYAGGDFPSWSGWLTRAGSNQLPQEGGLKINSTAAVISRLNQATMAHGAEVAAGRIEAVLSRGAVKSCSEDVRGLGG